MTEASPDTASGPIRPGMASLIVRDVAGLARYYEEMIGLARIEKERDCVRLGAGGRVLLELRGRPGAVPESSGLAGLFHMAFLLPSRAELGRWLARAIRARVPFDGASDHLVSEALYLSDPEGNGIEVYADRPRQEWRWSGEEVQMETRALDVAGLVAAGGEAVPEEARVPEGTRIGHLHLRVGSLPEAERFYVGALGLAITCRYPGALFYATGRYHHHLATNTWQSRNSPKRPGTTTGLASFELLVSDGAAFEAAAERLISLGGRRTAEAIEACDPWGSLVILKRA